MPGNKKPRKRREIRRATVPMMMETRKQIRLDLYARKIMYLEDPCEETHEDLGRLLVIMSAAIDYYGRHSIQKRRDPAANAVRTLLLTMEAIEARAIRMEKWGITDDEQRSIMTAVAGMDSAIDKITKDIWDEATLITDAVIKRR